MCAFLNSSLPKIISSLHLERIYFNSFRYSFDIEKYCFIPIPGSSGVIDALFDLFLNYLCLESSLVYPVSNLFLAHLTGIKKNFPSFFGVTNACFFHTVKPFQGFSNYHRSGRSGHTLDLKDNLVCDGIAGCRNNKQNDSQHQNGKGSRKF